MGYSMLCFPARYRAARYQTVISVTRPRAGQAGSDKLRILTPQSENFFTGWGGSMSCGCGSFHQGWKNSRLFCLLLKQKREKSAKFPGDFPFMEREIVVQLMCDTIKSIMHRGAIKRFLSQRCNHYLYLYLNQRLSASLAGVGVGRGTRIVS